MRVVKFIHPEYWACNLMSQTPSGKGEWGSYKFEINNDCSTYDILVVHGDLNRVEQVRCPSENVVYITDEVFPERQFHSQFLQQFATVITSRQDIVHQNLVKSQYLCAWFLLKDYDFLHNLRPEELHKDCTLSVVSSNRTKIEGHRKRFEFVNKSISHFKDQLAVFGHGFNRVKDKFDVLAAYKYSIAIENSIFPDYFTEKLFDCHLSYCMPIYYGCPNVGDYFPNGSYLLIDINDHKKSFEIIERAIEERYYERNLSRIIEARNLVLDQFQMIPALVKLLDSINFDAGVGSSKSRELRPERFFTNKKPFFQRARILFNRIRK